MCGEEEEQGLLEGKFWKENTHVVDFSSLFDFFLFSSSKRARAQLCLHVIIILKAGTFGL